MLLLKFNVFILTSTYTDEARKDEYLCSTEALTWDATSEGESSYLLLVN